MLELLFELCLFLFVYKAFSDHDLLLDQVNIIIDAFSAQKEHLLKPESAYILSCHYDLINFRFSWWVFNN